MRSLLLLPLAMFSLPALAAPAMVTTAKGDVKLAGADQALQAPFVLNDGQSLELSDGALVVLLYQGAATQVTGPTTLSHAQLEQAAASSGGDASVLNELLARGTSTARAGATRAAGELQLQRPVPGGAVLNAQTIAWTCGDCGEQSVQVYSFRDDEVVWTGAGTDQVAFGGEPLSPGPYSVTVGATEFSFTVAKKDLREQVAQSMPLVDSSVAQLKEQGVSDAAVLLSVPASVYLQAGLGTEALYLVDAALAESPQDPGLLELKKTLEQRAGLH